MNENLVWVDWVEKFADNIKTSMKSLKKKKEFLDGVIDKIVINAEMGKDRNGREVQVGHSFDVKFKLKIVNDKLIWNDEGDKSKGYNVKDGKNLYKTGFIHEVSARKGVSKLKKKA